MGRASCPPMPPPSSCRARGRARPGGCRGGGGRGMGQRDTSVLHNRNPVTASSSLFAMRIPEQRHDARAWACHGARLRSVGAVSAVEASPPPPDVRRWDAVGCGCNIWSHVVTAGRMLWHRHRTTIAAHTFAPSPCRRLHHDRVADLVGHRQQVLFVFNLSVVSGDSVDACPKPGRTRRVHTGTAHNDGWRAACP